MNPKYKKIYCCTPVAFHANDGFWIRDTGLISNTLRTMGSESKCIMPLPHYEDDQNEHLIRTEYKNLKSVAWWKSLGIDALILYSWGAPKYLPIARAVRKAGIRLIIHMDTSGNFEGSNWEELPLLKKFYRYFRVKITDFFRAKHMRQATVLTMGPTVVKQISKRLFYGKWVCTKTCPTACPVSPSMRYENTKKEDIILCIGRWQDENQKRPEFMMRTLEQYYATGGTATTKIFGHITEKLKKQYSELPPKTAARIQLCGYTRNALLKDEYNKAKIMLCPSKFEGSHNVSAEALCCGCSIVTTNRPDSLKNLHWYTSKNSGTISEKDTPESLAAAIQQELEEWQKGNRNPQIIAEAWQPYFHVDKVLNNIFQ